MRLEGDGLGGGSLPRWVKPQLCKLVDKPPEVSGWLHESSTTAIACTPAWTAARLKY